jgi:hypothetical protein
VQELRNPRTLAIYGIDPETGLVKVVDKEKIGLYTVRGEWRSGDIFDVSPLMCLWVGGPNPVGKYGSSFRQL